MGVKMELARDTVAAEKEVKKLDGQLSKTDMKKKEAESLEMDETRTKRKLQALRLEFLLGDVEPENMNQEYEKVMTVLAMKKENYLKELDLEDLVKKSNNRSEILKGLEGKRSESKDKEKLKNIGMAEKFISTYLDENGEILKKGRAIELRMYDHIDMVQRAFDMKGEGFAAVLR